MARFEAAINVTIDVDGSADALPLIAKVEALITDTLDAEYPTRNVEVEIGDWDVTS